MPKASSPNLDPGRTPEEPGSPAGQANGYALLALILLAALLIAVAIWVYVGARITDKREAAIANLLQSNGNLVIAHKEKVKAGLAHFEQILQSIADIANSPNAAPTDARRRLNELLSSAQATTPELIALAVIDPDGGIRATTQASSALNVSGRDYFLRHREFRSIRADVGTPFTGALSGRWAIPITRRIESPEGNFEGVAYLSLDPTYFAQPFVNSQQGPRDSMVVLGEDGIIRAIRIGNSVLYGESVAQSPLLAEQRRAPTGWLRAGSPIDGDLKLVSYDSIPTYRLIVVVAKSETDLLAELRPAEQALRMQAAAVTALLILMAVTAIIALNAQRGRIRAESSARRNFQELAELGSDWHWRSDRHHRIDFVSHGLKKSLGVSIDGLLGLTAWESGGFGASAESGAQIQQAMLHFQPFLRVESSIRVNNTDTAYVLISGQSTWSAKGEFLGYQGVVTDITERKLAEINIQRLAMFDALTGLPNRRSLTQHLTHILTNCREQQASGALIFVDVDRFKDVNDTLGHEAGDDLLRMVAAALSSAIRADDVVSRIGGDEFVVVIGKLASDLNQAKQSVQRVIQKIRERMQALDLLRFRKLQISLSMGVCQFPLHNESPDDLLRDADTALYQSKSDGRNKVTFFEREMRELIQRRVTLEHDLAHALERGQMQVWVQSQYDTDAVASGAELLLRWSHPRDGMVPPSEFIPLSERSELIDQLGDWVIERAIETLASTEHLVARLPGLSVNVSPRQFDQSDFVERVLSRVRASSITPDRLTLEVTEGLLIDNLERTLEQLHQLAAAGIRISIDDFGTGYSSLRYLKSLPIHELKIDRCFVSEVPESLKDAAIVRSILSLARNLRLRVVAEGVETTRQAEFLRAHGCHSLQGYLFARPEPLQDWLVRQIH